jgi:hypothetical protein
MTVVESAVTIDVGLENCQDPTPAAFDCPISILKSKSAIKLGAVIWTSEAVTMSLENIKLCGDT